LFTQKYDSVAHYANLAFELGVTHNGGEDNLFLDMNLWTWIRQSEIDTNPDAKAISGVVANQGSVPLMGDNSSRNREIALFRSVASSWTTNELHYPSREFIALFDTLTDLRCEFFFYDYIGRWGIISGDTLRDSRRRINRQAQLQKTNGFSYPEILLMRAEGRARTGNLAGAVEDLNLLRQYRHRTGTSDLTLAQFAGQDAVIQEVINERRRELPIQSPKRVFDLKRFINEPGKPWSKTSITHTVKGVTYTANIDSDAFIIPITNDILVWNPQWGIPLETRLWSNVIP